jgi:hypothetical protein
MGSPDARVTGRVARGGRPCDDASTAEHATLGKEDAMDDWRSEALALAADLAARGEVKIESGGDEYVFSADDVLALGLLVLCGGPDRTGEVVCAWLDCARSRAAARAGRDA